MNNSNPSLRRAGEPLCLGRTNFIIMAVAAALVVTGFVLMSGPGCTMREFVADVFSPRRVVWAPTVCVAGYLLMIVGILWRR